MLWHEIMSGLPEIILAMAAIIALIRGAWRDEGSYPVIFIYALVALAIAFGFSFYSSENDITGFFGLSVFNGFTQLFKQMILLSVMTVLIMSYRYLEKENLDKPEYIILMLLSTTGMMVMVSASDLMSFFMGLELQSLSIYIMVAFQREQSLATESALKYFILGTLSTVFILYGSSLLYGEYGSTQFQIITALMKSQASLPIGTLAGVLLLLAGTGFKISLAPFHMWTPDVYQGSPMPVTAFLSSAPKIAGIALFIRLIIEVFHPAFALTSELLTILSILSMIVGTFAALLQKNIKRMLAYSTISHMGYALLGIIGGHFEGIQSVLIYISIYVIMTLGMFACLLTCRRQGKQIEDIDELVNLSAAHPLIAGLMTVLLFSLAGIPPMAGFFAKFGVFSAIVEKEFYGLALIGVLTSVVAAAFYLRIVKNMYFAHSSSGGEILKIDHDISRETYAIMFLSVILVLGYSISSSWLNDATYNATKALFYRL